MLDRPPPPRVARVMLAARSVLKRALDAPLPPDVAAWEHALAFTETRMLGAVAEHGVADVLAERPATAAEIADRLALNADALHRVMRALAVRGFFRLDRRGRFRLTRMGQALRSDRPDAIRPWILYLNLESTQRAWAAVGDTLRTGEPSFPAVHGKSIWAHFAEHQDEERLFATAMRRLTMLVGPEIAAAYPWPERGTVCDVAGGVGTLLAAVLRERPDLRGVLVDVPGVLAEAEEHLRRDGLRDRVDLREGDMFERVDARADVYVLKDVLHDWDDERCARILATVRAAMPDGARLVLAESLIEPDEPHPIHALIDVHMLTQCDGGRQRSADELFALMRDAGFRPGGVYPTAGPALVEGIAGS